MRHAWGRRCSWVQGCKERRPSAVCASNTAGNEEQAAAAPAARGGTGEGTSGQGAGEGAPPGRRENWRRLAERAVTDAADLRRSGCLEARLLDPFFTVAVMCQGCKGTGVTWHDHPDCSSSKL